MVTLAAMYITQPIQPLLAEIFNVSIVKASQFTTIILIFMAISPIVYGYFLENTNAKKILFNALIILFICNIFLGLANDYYTFLFFRTIQALVLPAILTSLMSILANIDKANIKTNMSIYVAATVFGGLLGRILTGYISANYSYKYAFYFLSFILLIVIFLIKKLNYNGESNLSKAHLKDIIEILKQRKFILIYFLMFNVFFVFSAILNTLPFRIKEIYENANEFTISLVYMGYIMGILISLNLKKIVKIFKTELFTVIVALIIFIFTTLFLTTNNTLIFFGLFFIFCIGMFTCHSVSTGLANSLKNSQKALTSGMYLTFYYIGGSLGSFIPAIIYNHFNWNTMIYFLVSILIITLLVILLNIKKLIMGS